MPRQTYDGRMLKELNERLLEISELTRDRKTLQKRLHSIDSDITRHSDKATEFKLLLDKELTDVIQLENSTFIGLLYAILGKKEKKLSKEKQEYLAAKLKYDDAKESLEDLRAQHTTVQEQLDRLDQLDCEYQELLRKKESIVCSTENTYARLLFDLSEKLATLKGDAKELTESVTAGRKALTAISDVRTQLKSAEESGVWDMFLSNNIIADFDKHSAIDRAKTAAHHAHECIRIFQREVADVMTVNLLGDLSCATLDDLFIDAFFDNFIIDWMYQAKILRSLESTDKAHSEIASLVNNLEGALMTVRKQMESVEQERQLALVRIEDT